MKLDPIRPDPFFMPGFALCSVRNELEGASPSGYPKPIRSLDEILKGMPAVSSKIPSDFFIYRIPYDEFRLLKQKWEEAQSCADQLHHEYAVLSVYQDPEMYAAWIKKRERLDHLVKELLPTWWYPWPDSIYPRLANLNEGIGAYQTATDIYAFPQLQQGLKIVQALKVFLDELPSQISQEGLSLRGR